MAHGLKAASGGVWLIGHPAGIAVRIHWTFALLLIWVGWGHLAEGHGVAGAVGGVALMLALFGCVVLHELGHALAARRYGIPTRDITLYPIGGVARLERMPEDPRQELVVAAAGPGVNAVLAVGLAALLTAGGWGDFLAAGPALGAPLLVNLAWANVALALFNLLPAFPMDGGRVLRARLAMRMPRARATRIAASVGKLLAMGLALLGLMGSPLLVFVALFVALGGEQEARAVEAASMLGDKVVSDLMQTDLLVLDALAPLQTAVDALLARDQVDFPVVDGEGALVGVLGRTELVQGLAAGGLRQPLGPLVDRDAALVAPGTSLAEAFGLLQAGGAVALAVVEGPRLVGLLTRQNVSEWLMVQAALGLSPAATEV